MLSLCIDIHIQFGSTDCFKFVINNLNNQYISQFSIESMATKEQQLDSMLRQEQKNQLSSEEEEGRGEVTSKNQFRKPIKNPFSDDSERSDSDLEGNKPTGTPFINKPPLPTKTALQQAQQQMRWDKNEQLQTEILAKLEGQGMKDKKIKQLASKYKALNIAYEKQKTQRKNLQTQLNSMMKTTDDLNKSSVSKKQKLNKSIEKTTSQICTNCQQNQKKIMDFRLKNQNLKSQLNKATRVISRELGEDFNIDQVLNEDNGWKGRQQKIEKLKARVKQLEDKLNNNGINVSHMSGFTAAQQTNTAFTGTRTSALMAENKRKELDNLKIQVDALKSENEILQGKVKSLVSRKVILQNQIKQVKAEFEKKRQLLIEKSNNDDKFIELLKNENEKLKKQEKVVTKVIYKEDNADVTQLKRQIEMLRKKLKAAQSAKGSTHQIVESISKEKSQQKQEKRVSKDLNSNGQPPRIVSAEKKKRMEEQYLKSNKYMNKMSSQEEEQLYKNWKSSNQLQYHRFKQQELMDVLDHAAYLSIQYYIQSLYKSFMNNQPKAEAKQNNSNISDDLEELEEDSSYEKTNQIYSLNSQVNQLRKDKQKLLIDLEAKIKAHKTLQNKYDRLVAQANERKVENSNLIATVNRLEHENEELKNIIETHGGHLETANRRTADFHRSIEEFKDSGLGDPRDLIDQLLAKDNQIEKLKQAIIQLEGKPRQVEINSPLFEQKEEVSTLKQKIEELRKKQIAYKKQYESMLQGKEEIIKKIMSQNDDSFKKTIESKDKKIAELNKEVDEAKRRKQEISRELKDLTDKVSKYEQIIAKHKNELSKKQEQLKYSFELQKENIIKNLQQKSKKTLIQKQQKYSATEVSLATAENQLLINRQQISKLKIELASVGQYNTYLEGANKELEEGKKKMQASLYNKEEELIQVKDKCFMEISEVKRKMMEQRRAIEAKLYQVEEELLAKNFLIDKHERLLEEKKGKTVAENINSENALLEEVYQLKSEKQRLQRQVSQLEQANKIKTQTYIQLQKTLRQTYEERIQSLQAQKQLLSTQNIKQKQQMISQSSDVKETLDEKFHKLQMVCELLQIDKQQKNKQHKQLMSAKAKLQEKVKDLQQKKLACQNKIKECKEDYTALEVMYEELNEKYKTGVKDLEKEIQNMSVKIDDERRRAEKRKSQGNRAAIADKAQLDRANDKIQQLEKEVSELKNKQERQHLQNESLKEQVSRVNRQLSVTQRQRETLHRSHTRALSQTQHTYQHQKNTLLQYIQQLEQNISILNTKLSLSANKEENLLNTLSQLDRELKSIKVEYSVSLEQIKQLLNKCKQLEQLNKQAISHREAIKHNYEVNCQLFEESCRQKIQQELDSAYDQINKLNKVLMSKQEQLSKSRLAYQAPSSQHNLQITSVGSKHYIGQPPYPPSVPGSRMYLVPNAKDNAIYNPTAYESHSPLVSQHATQPANSYKVRVNRIS